MIIVRVPLRVSLAGGGTDLPAYYREYGPGAVTALAIDKHVWITLSPKFDGRVRVSWHDRNEIVGETAELQHDLARECLRLIGVRVGIEVVSIADVPGTGTGLGSSSAYVVGLLHALHVWRGDYAIEPAQLAAEACDVEIGLLGHPIGKQDQYMAAFGGVRFVQFEADESVQVDRIPLFSGTQEALEAGLLLWWTGLPRIQPANAILAEQCANTPRCLGALDELRTLALRARECLLPHWTGPGEYSQRVDLACLGDLVRQGWACKRSLAGCITNGHVNGYVSAALEAGAAGAKLLGAGGGGFLLAVCPTVEAQASVRKALGAAGLRELGWRVQGAGSTVVYRD